MPSMCTSADKALEEPGSWSESSHSYLEVDGIDWNTVLFTLSGFYQHIWHNSRTASRYRLLIASLYEKNMPAHLLVILLACNLATAHRTTNVSRQGAPRPDSRSLASETLPDGVQSLSDTIVRLVLAVCRYQTGNDCKTLFVDVNGCVLDNQHWNP